MENWKYTAAPSVKSEQKLVFGGLGTGLDMTDCVVKTLTDLLCPPFILLFLISVLEYNSSLTQLLHKNTSLFLQALIYL